MSHLRTETSLMRVSISGSALNIQTIIRQAFRVSLCTEYIYYVNSPASWLARGYFERQHFAGLPKYKREREREREERGERKGERARFEGISVPSKQNDATTSSAICLVPSTLDENARPQLAAGGLTSH